jgi:hypothetical protein
VAFYIWFGDIRRGSSEKHGKKGRNIERGPERKIESWSQNISILSDLSDLSDFEVFEVTTIVTDNKRSPDRKSDISATPCSFSLI